jgi:uncharacterized OB-fold protein
MIAPLLVERCARCGYPAYPPRALCPRCGAGSWRRGPAGSGTVEELTVRSPVFEHRGSGTRLASVRLDAGPVVIARAPGALAAGDRVRLVTQGSAALAQPISPGAPGQAATALTRPATRPAPGPAAR